jgi:hypothetical protein
MTEAFNFKKYLQGLSHEVHTETMADVNAAYTALTGKFSGPEVTPDHVIALVQIMQNERTNRAHLAGRIFAARAGQQSEVPF